MNSCKTFVGGKSFDETQKTSEKITEEARIHFHFLLEFVCLFVCFLWNFRY